MEMLVRATEMGKLLGGVHPCTVLRWAEQGLIPSVLVGRYRRFEPDAVLATFRDGTFEANRAAMVRKAAGGGRP
jgi:DNA-binding transcriptional MerR regulator